MKIFKDDESSWFSKINFVDKNDVFVGYDMEQSCCEHADWFISETIDPYSYNTDYDSLKAHDVEGYIFDKEFFLEVESCELDSGCQVAFRMVAEDKPDLYLSIFNSHNGYYGHGFSVEHSGETVKEGTL